MVASRTIQHNGDRTNDISFVLLSHIEENDQKVGLRDLKWRNKAQNRNLHEKLSKIGLVEKFWLWSKSTVNDSVNNQRSMLVTVNAWDKEVCWRGMLMWQCDITLGLTWQHVKQSRRVWEHVANGTSAWGAWEALTAHGGAWSACSWGQNFSQHVEARVM